MTLRRGLHYVIAGAVWGAVAYLLGARAFGVVIWGGVLASPVFGLVVGWATGPWFERCTGFRRWAVALASLYLGGTMFGLAVGVHDWLAGATGRSLTGVVGQSVLAVWWGITVTGFLIALWPMAYATHALLQWAGENG